MFRRLSQTAICYVLLTCLPATRDAAAAGTEPFVHGSRAGILTQTTDGDIIDLQFESASGRVLNLFFDTKKSSVSFEGLQIYRRGHQLVASYGSHVVVAGSASELSENDAAPLGHLVSYWRDDRGLADELVALRAAFDEYTAKRIRAYGRQIHPLMPLVDCGWSIFAYESAWIWFFASPDFASTTAVIIAAQNMCDSCGGCDCQTVTGFEQC
jgi:hypothetical protein